MISLQVLLKLCALENSSKRILFYYIESFETIQQTSAQLIAGEESFNPSAFSDLQDQNLPPHLLEYICQLGSFTSLESIRSKLGFCSSVAEHL